MHSNICTHTYTYMHILMHTNNKPMKAQNRKPSLISRRPVKLKKKKPRQSIMRQKKISQNTIEFILYWPSIAGHGA